MTVGRRLVRHGAAPVVAAVVIVVVASLWVSLGPSANPTRANAASRDLRAAGVGSTGSGPGTAAVPPLGVYVGPGQAATAEAVDQQLSGKVAYALDYLTGGSWTTLTDPSWLAAAWASSPLELVVGVPMLPASGATLAEGAAGAYDGQFALLAQRLVDDGLSSVVLMIGDQPDDAGRRWYVGSAATARDYVRYWDDIRTTMASTVGAHFLYEWDPGDSGTSPVSPAVMYPGNTAVSIVATDAFEGPASVPAGSRWSAVLDERYGPAWMAAFAAAHGKPMALAMWGVVPAATGGGGDDGTYVTQLLQWAAAEKLQMCMLWDDGTWAVTGGAFPDADAALTRALSSESTTSAVPARTSS